MNKNISLVEFVILMALLTTLGAMATDAMLPALSQIGQDLGLKDVNEAQFIVYYVFAGFAFGQIFYGPISDSIGRKKSIYIALIIFIIGSFICISTESFYIMLFGRFLQGFGAAGPKIVTLALIRDQYSGAKMAKILSFISVVFILVPAIAPMIGGFILKYGSWKNIFLMFITTSIISFIWFFIRQEETLLPKNQKKLNFTNIKKDIIIIFNNKTLLLYTAILGILFGVFISYLSTAEQIFAIGYNLGEKFPFYFAINSLPFGFASLLNARLVEKFGMKYLCVKANIALCIICLIYLVFIISIDTTPSLLSFMIFCMSIFFSIGILFGNLNALAIEPMEKLAGMAASAIGVLSMFIALPVGILIGQLYDNTITPLVIGFSLAGGISYFLLLKANSIAIR